MSSAINTDTSPPNNIHRMQTRSKNNITKPIKKLTLIAALLKSPSTEPQTIQQALKYERWRQDASTEFGAIIQNKTWDLVPHNLVTFVKNHLFCIFLYKNIITNTHTHISTNRKIHRRLKIVNST